MIFLEFISLYTVSLVYQSKCDIFDKYLVRIKKYSDFGSNIQFFLAMYSLLCVQRALNGVYILIYLLNKVKWYISHQFLLK